jgi:uncharacterized membrane protein
MNKFKTRIGYALKILGILSLSIGLVLICLSEIVIYLSNFSDFEHELTNEEKTFEVKTFCLGFLSVVFGLLLIVVGNLKKWRVKF